ncbi:MAG: sulfatase-like hydrolase/transferase [Lentisphaeria bacterium]|nr:sulfatase-like hydrolase/transferase [Lentisphaeria bacterium]
MKNYLKTFSYLGFTYLINAVILLLFYFMADDAGVRSVIYFILSAGGYTLIYTLPAVIVAAAVFGATVKVKNASTRSAAVHWSCVAASFISVLLLLTDLGLYRGWGFHFNPLVYNLLTTPGGFASMGLRAENVVPLVAVIVFLAAFFGGLGYLCSRSEKLKSFAGKLCTLRMSIALFLVIALSFTCGIFMYGYERYRMEPEVLASAKVIPLSIPVSMKSFFKKIGVKAPDRQGILLRAGAGTGLRYPAKAVVRDGKNMKYNVVWLACESWRGDMLNEKVMPNAWKMAQKSIRFTNNLSGGNGTRMGVFSMFYGLYGNYWHPVLNSRRGPVFMDWLIEDGYKFFCVTSAKFSYPEFDHTVFARVPSDSLLSDDNGATFQRDQRNVKKLCKFIADNRDKGPFFGFMFFESPHAPYEFPAENIIEPDYHKSINYASVSKEAGPAIKRRYMNACNHLDSRLKEVFDTLEKYDMLKNTIVVLVGDHGEEFFEKGRLGHNSTFVKEQIHTPLVMHIPGAGAKIYDKMSSHFDIVPMLAPYFGVTSPAEDYCLGYNLLDGKSERTYSLASGWSELFFIGSKHKILLPTTSLSSATNKLYDINDKEVEGKDKFFADNVSLLMKIQLDSQRFNK